MIVFDSSLDADMKEGTDQTKISGLSPLYFMSLDTHHVHDGIENSVEDYSSSRMLSSVGCRMSDVGCRMTDDGCRMSDVGCRMSDVGCR